MAVHSQPPLARDERFPRRTLLLDDWRRLGCGKSLDRQVGNDIDLGVRILPLPPAEAPPGSSTIIGAGISEQTYYKWRREYGGLKIDQAKRLKELERENERLKKAVSELTLDKQILKEALSGKY